MPTHKGQIVLYKVNPSDSPELRNNYAQILPAVVVMVWTEETVNLKVFTDGPIDSWKTSVVRGSLEGQWQELPE